MARFSVIDAPSILGLRPSGVQNLPRALKDVRLIEKLHAESAGQVVPLPYQPERDRETLLLNPEAIKEFSLQLVGADHPSSVDRALRLPRQPFGDERFGQCTIAEPDGRFRQRPREHVASKSRG